MSEKHPRSAPEHLKPSFERNEQARSKEHESTSPETHDNREHEQQEAGKEAEAEALAAKEYSTENTSENKPADHITRLDKQRAYTVTLSRIQSQLTGPAKRFSKVIHSKPVETLSSGLEKTVARPSAMLGAALSATFFLAIMLFFARRNGFALSGSELPVALGVGWLIGLATELLIRLTRRLGSK